MMEVLYGTISGEVSVMHPSSYCTHFRGMSPRIDVYDWYQPYQYEDL